MMLWLISLVSLGMTRLYLLGETTHTNSLKNGLKLAAHAAHCSLHFSAHSGPSLATCPHTQQQAGHAQGNLSASPTSTSTSKALSSVPAAQYTAAHADSLSAVPVQEDRDS